VKDVRQLAHTIRQAFYLARSGRPGPVLVDLPKDVMQAKASFVWPEDVRLRSYNPNYKPHAGQIKKVAQLIRDAERPLIYAGGGVITSKGHEALTRLAKTLHIPVTATLMGLDCFPGDDERLWLGMLGMHGTYAANMAINNADLVLAVGARFDDRVTGKVSTFAPKATLVHIDIDPTSIQKNVSVHVPLVADCRLALEALKEELEQNLEDYDYEGAHMPWITKVGIWATEHPLTYKPCNGCIKPQAVVEKLYELTGGDAVICTEVGQNQMWAAQFYKFKQPNTFLSSGGLGTMGYGFPAAIGAQFARPDKLVIDVAGDGSIQMNIQELATSVCNRLGVKIVILNNAYLGMVRQWQELFYKRNYCETCMEAQPDFVKLAEAYGAKGFRISDPADLDRVLKQALETPSTVIVDVQVEREENVYPMVPAGASLTDMLLV
jgi:acetolactate synthase-1/2/3 large subunit